MEGPYNYEGYIKSDGRISLCLKIFDTEEHAEIRAKDVRAYRDECLDKNINPGPTYNPMKYGAVEKYEEYWAVVVP